MIQKYKDDSLYGAILRPNDNGTLCYVADCLAEIAKKDILLQEQHKIIGDYAQRNEELNEMEHKAQEKIATLTAERDKQNDFIDKVEMAYPEFYEHHREALRSKEVK